MKVYREVNDFCDIELWSGGKDTLLDLELLKQYDGYENTLDLVWNCLEDMFIDDEELTETAINDFMWFERDTIAQWLGFNNYDELMKKISD